MSECQSCGMPISENDEYCSHCYQDGKFTMPDLTLDDMKRRVRAKLADVGVPPERAEALTQKIGTLKRWRRS